MPLNKALRDKVKKSAQPKPQVDPAIQSQANMAVAEAGNYQDKLTKLNLKYDPTNLEKCQALFQTADDLRFYIKERRKAWRSLMYGSDKDEKTGPIPLARATVDALYDVNRKVDQPWEKAEKAVTAGMEQFKRDEASHVRQLDEAREAEAQRLREEAYKKDRLIQSAATPQLKAKLEARRQELLDEANTVQDQVPETVVASGSTTRHNLAWRLDSPEEFPTVAQAQEALKIVLKAVLDGKIPVWAVKLDDKAISAYLKIQPAEVMEWEGIEVYEDIGIVSTRR